MISREIRRNSGPGGYFPIEAQQRADARRKRPRPRKLERNRRLHDEVDDGLKRAWSPRQISGRLRLDFPDDTMMRVSAETIYQCLFLQAKGLLRTELTLSLRQGRIRRRPRSRVDGRRSGPIKDPVLISERPAEVEDRAVPGHWEGDLIIGRNHKSHIATIVERTTRYLVLVHVPGRRTAEHVGALMAERMQRLPELMRKSITWDRGTEMARHADFTVSTGIPIYFCDPHSPWQRGTNENTNGLLRQFFPKNDDLSAYTQADLDHVADLPNDRPRETFGWLKPNEVFADLVKPR